MPQPTKPPCSGSWPDPPPDTSPTLPARGASPRITTLFSASRRSDGCAEARPANASVTTSSGALMSFFIGCSPRSGPVDRASPEACSISSNTVLVATYGGRVSPSRALGRGGPGLGLDDERLVPVPPRPGRTGPPSTPRAARPDPAQGGGRPRRHPGWTGADRGSPP